MNYVTIKGLSLAAVSALTLSACSSSSNSNNNGDVDPTPTPTAAPTTAPTATPTPAPTAAPVGFEDAIFKLDDQVDRDLNMRGVVYRTSADFCKDVTDPSKGLCTAFESAMSLEQDGAADGARVHNVMEDASLTVDAATFKATTSVSFDTTVNQADAFWGAVNPAAATPWFANWTVDITDDTATDLAAGNYTHPLADNWGSMVPGASGGCPATTTEDGTVDLGGTTFVVCVIKGDILADLTLTNDYVYVTVGDVKVGDGDVEDVANAAAVANPATLTIGPGVSIFAKAQDGSQIRVTRGSQIIINGTADMPVVMAAATYVEGAGITDGAPLDFSGRGDWGGLVVNGFATTNNGDGAGDNVNEIKSEAGKTSDTGLWFGGSDDTDSSGSISYLVLVETGFAFAPNEEVQGLTLEGVGSGTTIQYVQIAGSEDDGVEIFGGTNDVSYIVIHDVIDDSVDLDDGYRGTVKYVIALQGAFNGDAAIEADNKGASNDAEPKTTPVIANGLFIGNNGQNSKKTVGASLKDGHGGDLEHVIFVDKDFVQ